MEYLGIQLLSTGTSKLSVLYKNIQQFLIANNFYLHLYMLDAKKALRKLFL